MRIILDSIGDCYLRDFIYQITISGYHYYRVCLMVFLTKIFD